MYQNTFYLSTIQVQKKITAGCSGVLSLAFLKIQAIYGVWGVYFDEDIVWWSLGKTPEVSGKVESPSNSIRRWLGDPLSTQVTHDLYRRGSERCFSLCGVEDLGRNIIPKLVQKGEGTLETR